MCEFELKVNKMQWKIFGDIIVKMNKNGRPLLKLKRDLDNK